MKTFLMKLYTEINNTFLIQVERFLRYDSLKLHLKVKSFIPCKFFPCRITRKSEKSETSLMDYNFDSKSFKHY